MAARDVAVVTLLYGCGLRISEALALRQADAPLGEALRIRGKGGRERVVPVLPVAARAVETYRALVPFAPAPDAALFLGARGGALNPRLVQQAMQAARAQLGLPATATPHACATPSPPTCSRPAATCAPSRSCSATPRSPAPRSTPGSTRPG